jgi:ribonuclease-3
MSVDPELLERALTHRSFAYEQGGLPTNERLEFLGDSVLGLVVTEHLFVSYPDLSEGQLAKLRAAVVNSRACRCCPRLGPGCGDSAGSRPGDHRGRDKSSILADTMEAVIRRDLPWHGIDAARTFVHHLFDSLMADVATRGAGLDWRPRFRRLPRWPVSACRYTRWSSLVPITPRPSRRWSGSTSGATALAPVGTRRKPSRTRQR